MSEVAKAKRTTLIAAFEGWNDACQAATNVVRHLISHYESREVRHIRCDGYYDYQTSRPMMCHVTGRARILWPQTTFYDITVDDDTHIYAQIAPEPNYRWLDYCRESLHIAEEFEIDKIITLGSMFADCPHTRPLPLDVSDRGCQCDMDREYNGPVGLTTVLDSSAAEQGFDTSSLWVSVPQYLGSDECAQGTLQMLDSLSCVLGVDLDRGDLQKRAAVWRSQAEVLTRCNDDLADYVARLEREYDLKVNAKKVGDFGTPQAEQLVQETEAFLKNIDG
ncbi:MAG: PAC2 family protein [Bifidobacterium sp.]|jgi:hypothetical protein|nr:PAC2 family protein [Bifidobacterium sp.]MCI1864545.1 PAC2 family protein [Bifidobacterium sp.]